MTFTQVAKQRGVNKTHMLFHIKAVSAIEQTRHLMHDVIISLASDWFAGQLDDAMTNNDQSEARQI